MSMCYISECQFECDVSTFLFCYSWVHMVVVESNDLLRQWNHNNDKHDSCRGSSSVNWSLLAGLRLTLCSNIQFLLETRGGGKGSTSM